MGDLNALSNYQEAARIDPNFTPAKTASDRSRCQYHSGSGSKRLDQPLNEIERAGYITRLFLFSIMLMSLNSTD
jgi:hypothetical protein